MPAVSMSGLRHPVRPYISSLEIVGFYHSGVEVSEEDGIVLTDLVDALLADVPVR